MRVLMTAAFAVASLFSVASSVAADTTRNVDIPDLQIPFTKTVLDNGLTVIVHEDHKAPLVAINIWYHVGSKNERPGRTGFAHLFEHLMFQGSENYNDEFFRPFEQVGATDMNGTTSEDRTNYFQTVPKNALDMALFMESDRMGHLLGVVDQARLDEQRGVVQNEKRQRENAPYGRAWDQIVKHTYPKGHPYSWSVIGEMEDLEAASLDDVKEWFKTYYGAANATLVIAGDVKSAEVVERVKHWFGDIPAGPALSQMDEWIAPIPGPRRRSMQDRVPQARLYKVWNAPPVGSEGIDYLSLAASLLADGKNSRLYKRLVYDDQIATDVVAYVDERKLSSQLYLWATAKPGVALAEIESAMNEELQKFLAAGPSNEELERVRTSILASIIKGSEKVGGFGGKADLLASSQVLLGSPDAFQISLQRLRSATPRQIQDAAKRWYNDGVFTLEVEPLPKFAVGPAAKRDQLPKAGDSPALKLPKLQHAKLDNGLEIVIAERHETPVVYFDLMFHNTGFATDHGGKPGLATLTMSMLDEGTKQHDALGLAAKLEMLGTSLSSSASLDTASIGMSALSTRLDASLGLMSEVATTSTFPERELERLRQSRLAKIAQEKARPIGLVLRTLPPLLFGGDHAYGMPLTGSGDVDSVNSIQQQDMVAWRDTWLKPNVATLLIVGDTTMQEVLPLVKKHFGNWAASKELPSLSKPTVANAEAPRVFLLDRPQAPQTMIIAGQLAPPRNNPDEVAIEAMNTILGGMFTSRLNMNLREDKSWAYGARTLLMGATAQRPFIAYAPVQTDKTAESMQEIVKELQRIQGEAPVSEAELSAAQKSMTLSLPGKHETAAEVAGSLAGLLIHALPESYYDEYVPKVLALKSEDITGAAKNLIKPSALTWVIVGDLSKIEAPVRALNLGEVTVLDANGKPVTSVQEPVTPE